MLRKFDERARANKIYGRNGTSEGQVPAGIYPTNDVIGVFIFENVVSEGLANEKDGANGVIINAWMQFDAEVADPSVFEASLYLFRKNDGSMEIGTVFGSPDIDVYPIAKIDFNSANGTLIASGGRNYILVPASISTEFNCFPFSFSVEEGSSQISGVLVNTGVELEFGSICNTNVILDIVY